jgi:hypothetical protein
MGEKIRNKELPPPKETRLMKAEQQSKEDNNGNGSANPATRSSMHLGALQRTPLPLQPVPPNKR